MPATVNSSDGSSLIREAEGTTVCCLLAKKSSQRRLISAVFMGYLAVFFTAGLLDADLVDFSSVS